jgi:hypothetical protein
MAGLRTVLPDALPLSGGEALAVPLAAVAATLVASLAVGLCLPRGKPGGRIPARVLRGAAAAPARPAGLVAGVLFLAACRRAAKERARTRAAA